MAIGGGSIRRLSLNGREFPVTSDAAFEVDYGGDVNTVHANGNMTFRVDKMASVGRIGGVVVTIDDSRGDHEYLNNIKNATSMISVEFLRANGFSAKGTMQIEDALVVSTDTSTASFALAGALFPSG